MDRDLYQRLVRIAQIGQSLCDTQFESRYDDLIDELGAELLDLSGICRICNGDRGEPDDLCPGCANTGLEHPGKAQGFA